MTSKRTAFESFGNPAILEGQGGRSFFHTFWRVTQLENEMLLKGL